MHANSHRRLGNRHLGLGIDSKLLSELSSLSLVLSGSAVRYKLKILLRPPKTRPLFFSVILPCHLSFLSSALFGSTTFPSRQTSNIDVLAIERPTKRTRQGSQAAGSLTNPELSQTSTVARLVTGELQATLTGSLLEREATSPSYSLTHVSSVSLTSPFSITTEFTQSIRQVAFEPKESHLSKQRPLSEPRFEENHRRLEGFGNLDSKFFLLCESSL